MSTATETKDSAIPFPLLDSLPANHREAIDRLIAAYRGEFGSEPDFVARAPGRVNLIGEHIDYCGFSVLPMAIDRHVLIAAGGAPGSDQQASADALLRIRHASSSERPGIDVTLTGPDGVKVDTAGGRPEWHQYVLCGFRGIQDHLGEAFQPPRCLNLMVTGDIPPGSGLSSSSALVVCSALVAMQSMGGGGGLLKGFGRRQMAALCAVAERHIGTEGGGMDQAISLCGEAGQALWINFKAGLETRSVTLPAGYSFVVAHSGRVMNKAATDEFNQRVAECRLTAWLLSNGTRLRLADALPGAASPSDGLAIVESRLRADPPFYTVADVASELGVDEADVRAACVTSEAAKRLSGFQLRRRASHVFGEAQRVLEFRDACGGGSPSADPHSVARRLGDLMNASHASCSQLYECSCPELDRLCHICREAGGALGSRMTGAGWGGCCVSLVPDDGVANFLAQVRAAFVGESKGDVEFLAFASRPGAGAYVVLL